MAITSLIVLKVFLIVIGFIIGLSLLQFFISVHPPRYYDPDNPSNYDLQYENITFITSDKIEIHAWLISSDRANATVIIGHGYPFNKGNILSVAKFLYPDYNLLFYDHRYFGESSGKITTIGMREVEDVKAAVNFVHKRFGEEEPIALYGFSLSAAAMMLSKTEVNAIISDSAYADLENMINHIYRIFGPLKFPFVQLTNFYSVIFFGTHPKSVSPALAITDTNIPILVIHGDKDSQVPVENAYELKESNPNIELWIVPNADHGQSYALAKNEYEKRVKEFLKKNMEQQRV